MPAGAGAIIFIPGIKGTKLVETNRATFDTLWSGIQSNFETIEDLALNRGKDARYFDEPIRSIIQPGEIEELAYGEFLHDLDTKLPIYIFNYDWRHSAKANGERLGEFVEYLKAKSAATKGVAKFQKFHFITHSLGNFVLRSYLKDPATFDTVDRIVFTVPPFRGSLDIVTACLIGEGWFPKVKSKIRRIIRTMPGALELLPNYANASKWQPGGVGHSFFEYDDWQSNVTDQDDQRMKAALLDAWSTVESGLLDLATLNKTQKKQLLVIARDGFETLQAANVQKTGPGGVTNFVDLEHALRTHDGDGRVPHASSCCYAAEGIKTLMLKDSLWYREYSHGFVLKDERAQKLVNRFLAGSNDFSITGGSVVEVEGLAQKKKGGHTYYTPSFA